ncbi:MAG: hypothetical protein CSA42_04740 [Gammaproteobacteria bacterium]|nr:MAG: hypothetical protein CSA42_04740 [Gammaproteobacteria bacterium]
MRNTNKTFAIFLIAMGLLVPLLGFLIADWLVVKQTLGQTPDWLFWTIYLSILLPCLFFGFKQLNFAITKTLFYTLLFSFWQIVITVLIILQFHKMIGGAF